PERLDGGQAVGDVQPRDAGQVTDRGEVDRAGPREEQPGVVIDGAARVGRKAQPQVGEAGLENVRILDGKGWEALDARRERLSPAAQAPLLGMCRVPSERVAPGDVLRTVGWCGLPRFGRFMAGFPRTPLEPGYPPPGTRVRMRKLRRRPDECQRGYPRIHAATRKLWINAGPLDQAGLRWLRPPEPSTDRKWPLAGGAWRSSVAAIAPRRSVGRAVSPWRRSPWRRSVAGAEAIARNTARSSSPTSSSATARLVADATAVGSAPTGPGSTSTKLDPEPGTDATSRSPAIAR